MNKRPLKPVSDILVRDIKLPIKKQLVDHVPKPKVSLFQRLLDRELHKHPFAIPIITLVGLSFTTMAGFILFGSNNIGTNDAHVVQLSVDQQHLVVPTRALTVKEFLARNKVK